MDKETQKDILTRLGSIDTTLARQEVHLKNHMRRSDMNEKAVEVLTAMIVPLQSHVSRVDGVIRFIGFAAIVVGLVTSITILWSKL